MNSLTPPPLYPSLPAPDTFWAPTPPAPQAVVAYLHTYCLEREEWDEVPELGVLRSVYGGQITGYPFPIPDGTWKAWDDPGNVLYRMATLTYEQGRTDHALLRRIDRDKLTDMVGVYFRSEALRAAPEQEESVARQRVAGRMPYGIRHLAGRREQRSVVAALFAPTFLRVAHMRDDPEKFETNITNPYAYRRNVMELGGALPWELLRLAHGLVRTLRPATRPNSPEEK